MNNLQELKVIEVTNPTIEFNYHAVKAQINELTEQYQGLVIQESDLQFTKDLLAYLNKLKKSVDDFRKDTKKEVSKPITEFEAQCKELVGSIDAVYGDIKKQYDQYEETRREEKAKMVNDMVKFAREQSELPPQYQLRINLKPEYLNKTMTEKKISDDLEKVIEELKSEWAIEKQRHEQIKTLCELESVKNGLTIPLDAESYKHLEFEQARIEIQEAAQRIRQQQEEAIRRLEEQARIKAEQEAQKEVERQAQELAKEQIEQAREQAESAMNLVSEMAEQVSEIIPTEHNDISKERLILGLHVSEAQKKALFAYLKQVDITYEVYA